MRQTYANNDLLIERKLGSKRVANAGKLAKANASHKVVLVLFLIILF